MEQVGTFHPPRHQVGLAGAHGPEPLGGIDVPGAPFAPLCLPTALPLSSPLPWGEHPRAASRRGAQSCTHLPNHSTHRRGRGAREMSSERDAAWWAQRLGGQILPRAKQDEHRTACRGGVPRPPQAPTRALGSLLHLRNLPSLPSFQPFPPSEVVGSPSRWICRRSCF